MTGQREPRWQWYERQIEALFRHVQGAEVSRNVKEMGADSRRLRQIDVMIHAPLKIELPHDFKISVPIKIIVDCKHYNKKLDLPTLEQVAGLKQDVRAHLAIVVSPRGVSDGVRNSAPSRGVYPLTVTTDLVTLAEKFDEFTMCLSCESGEVWWDFGFDMSGKCSECNSVHIRCPDCLNVFALPDSDQGIFGCPTIECEAVFMVDGDRDSGDHTIRHHDSMEVRILKAAYAKRNHRLTGRQVDKLVNSTRWQYWDADASPLIGLTEESLVEWTDSGLELTQYGINEVEDVILEAKEPEWYLTDLGGLLPQIRRMVNGTPTES